MKHMKLVFIIFAVVFILPSFGFSQDFAALDSLLQRRIEEIDQKGRILARKLELQNEEEMARAQQMPVLVAGNEGFMIQAADRSYLLRLRAHDQIDSRSFIADKSNSSVDAFVNRRMRFVFEGTVSKIFDFKFMPDFAGSRMVLQDVFMDVRLFPQLKFKIGKFKTPFGIERLQSPTNLLFIERGLPNNLVPNRDLGFQLHGDLAGGILNYMIGSFNGVVDGGSGDGDSNDNKDQAVRIMLAPFVKTDTRMLRGLSLGVAMTQGEHYGTPASVNLPGYNSPGQQTIFRYRSDGTATGSTVAAGTVKRVSPQAYYHWGRLGLLGEYVSSSHQVVRGANAARLQHSAWQVAGSYSLTGEPASYKGMTPKKSFDLAKGIWGSFELVGRYNVLQMDKNAFPVFANPNSSVQQAKAWAAGLNWYLNRNVKIVLNYELTTFLGGSVKGNRVDEKALFIRFQLGY